MTSSESKSSGNASACTVQRKTAGGECMSRKASFKCSTPNKVASQRVSTRKVVLPLSTVQALTFKFNELTQMAEGQKHRINQAAVKNFLSSTAKSNAIKVVICRKSSSSKHKKLEEAMLKKKIKVKRFGNRLAEEIITGVEGNSSPLNVYQKITEFEEMEKAGANKSKSFNGKTPMPKILVDIDLSGENGSSGHERDNENLEKNRLTVKTAINLFEKKNAKIDLEKRCFELVKCRPAIESEGGEAKAKPIAAIKPILKKPDVDKKEKKTKLLPKDSLNRKRYILMKRETSKTGKSREENSDEDVTKKDGGEAEKKSTGLSNGTTENKLKNDSSLHKQYQQQNGFSFVTKDIPINENESFRSSKIKHSHSINQNLKPNTSFLWSKKEESLYGDKRGMNRMDLPLPNPPDNYIPDINDKTDDSIYDDVLPKCKGSESEEFEKMDDTDGSETYDDVGVYNRNNEINKRNRDTQSEYPDREVRLRNRFNEMLKEDACSYLYDDGEGEKYQYISDNGDPLSVVDSDSIELYQYIQNNRDDTGNIYEDIQSIKCQLGNNSRATVKTMDEVKDIYEDVICSDRLANNNNNNNQNNEKCNNNSNNNHINGDENDSDSLNNCYESVYNGIYRESNGSQGYIKSDLSDTSNNSGRSTYVKSNSLYGMSAENAPGSDGILSVGGESDLTDNTGYHVTLFGLPCPNSETSQSNSDDWVEVTESDSEGTVYLVQEKPKKKRLAGGFFPQKEKRRWMKLQRKSNQNSDETKSQNADDHFYESVGHYENAEVIQEARNLLEAEQSNNVNRDQYYNDDQFIDDFDSQSSEDEAYADAKLPDIPSHGYNITKSLKAAGKKLRKNFSLRKSDLSKSLKRFKKVSSRVKVTEAVLGGGRKDSEADLSQKSESPSTPSNLSNSIYSNNSDSSSGSQNVPGCKNVGDLKNQRHRKSWTFRNKFKSHSADSTVDGGAALDTNRNSTFYLSLNEVKPKKGEKKMDLLNEIQSVLSKRNGNSSENLAEREVTMRHSDAGTTAPAAVPPAGTKFRPSVPPPPPPPSKTETTAANTATAITASATTEKTKYSDIIWGEKATNNCLYVESGLFDKQKKHSRCTESDSSLYAEIGLYAAANEYEMNSKKTQMFVDEPLYQFYTECVNQRARDDILNNYDSEGYEEINDYYSVINEKRRTIDIKNVRPNFEDFNEDVRTTKMTFRSIADRRTLWCQIPAVIESCILESLSDQARKLQEAKFEIITSEGSYMNSLNILENHFMKKVNDLNIITKRDFRILFSNIVSVKKCSENFLEDLENCWQNNIMLNGICDIVHKHSTTSFHVYTKYCKNQVCIYRTLRELLDKNWNFENALKEIESDPICQNLNIHSFLMLPMQRITRLPLLMGAVLARMDKSDDEFEICKASFDVLNKIVQDCDDEARRMEKCEEMLILSQQIEFPKDIRRIPIITGSRFLVKSGQVTQLVNRDENKLTFGKKFSKVTLTLFLFTDLLILAKKKNPRNYLVVDHCPRNLVQMQTTDGLTQLPVKLNSNSDSGGKFLMLLTMLENHEKKTVEMILSFEMESDRQRWLEAVTPKSSENPNECIYEEWDCPQVIALYEFTPLQPDELSLCIGDVVNVLKKMSDGWYQGERLRDGARGWFPQNHTQEVSSSHIRAKNKKLRYKLLALSGNLIDSQKINGK